MIIGSLHDSWWSLVRPRTSEVDATVLTSKYVAVGFRTLSTATRGFYVRVMRRCVFSLEEISDWSLTAVILFSCLSRRRTPE